jgi:hypothetical protein
MIYRGRKMLQATDWLHLCKTRKGEKLCGKTIQSEVCDRPTGKKTRAKRMAAKVP